MIVVSMQTADRENVSAMRAGKENGASGDLVTQDVTIMEPVMMEPASVTKAGKGNTALWMGVLMPAAGMVSVSRYPVQPHLSLGSVDVKRDGLDRNAT